MGSEHGSDVHICDTCGQLCLSEVGGPPDESFMLGMLEDCATVVTRRVMEA